MASLCNSNDRNLGAEVELLSLDSSGRDLQVPNMNCDVSETMDWDAFN